MAACAIVPISCGVFKTDSLYSRQIIQDAKSLRQAILNNDKKKIIDIFIRKHRDTRFSLADAYNYKFGHTLTDDFREFESGDFGYLMTVMAIDPPTYNAIELHKTWYGFYDLDDSAFFQIWPFHNMTSINAEYRRRKYFYFFCITFSINFMYPELTCKRTRKKNYGNRSHNQ